ncbi:MAG: lipopolysaccharide kinase InaA family protein, partial [Victivallaceae bacterium]
QLESANGVYSGDYLITENITNQVCFLNKCITDLLQLPEVKFQQFIAALSEMTTQLHQHGICHGDLSLRNIYYRNAGLPEEFAAKDFGLIDLDGAHNHASPLSLTARRGEAARIISSFVKLAQVYQIDLSRAKLTDCFTANYFANSAVELNGHSLEQRIDYLVSRKH